MKINMAADILLQYFPIFWLFLKHLSNLRRKSSVSARGSTALGFFKESSLMSYYKRRRKMIEFSFIYCLYRTVIKTSRVNRSVWMKQRSGHWWKYIAINTFNDQHWVENFRMKKDTFQMLCGVIGPYISRNNTSFRKCIPVELRVAISLYILGTPCEYRTVAHLFGISRASVCLILHEFCYAVSRYLAKRYISLPNEEELCSIMLGFEKRWGFPNCAGAIDGCHIPIISPLENHTDYYNRKGWYSILLQALVDNRYLFRDTCIGWPGSVHDARVLANSKIYEMGENGLYRNHMRNICGVQVPVVILGDPAYPLLQWLMKPFPETSQMAPEQKRFNYMLSRNRMVVENAFGRLKGRWRRLQKRLDCKTAEVPNLILTCCVLHNICETQGDEYLHQWDPQKELISDIPSCAQVDLDLVETEELTSATNIRNAFTRFFQCQ